MSTKKQENEIQKIRKKKSWFVKTISPTGETVNFYACMTKREFLSSFPGLKIQHMKFVTTPREILNYFKRTGRRYIKYKDEV